MLKWIEDQIGIKIKEDSWKEVDKLPLLYRDNYDFNQTVSLFGETGISSAISPSLN